MWWFLCLMARTGGGADVAIPATTEPAPVPTRRSAMGYFYPAVSCYKALQELNAERMVLWCKFWCVLLSVWVAMPRARALAAFCMRDMVQ